MKCQADCTCKRHTAQKRPEVREKQRLSNLGKNKGRKRPDLAAMNQDPNIIMKRRASMQKHWQDPAWRAKLAGAAGRPTGVKDTRPRVYQDHAAFVAHCRRVAPLGAAASNRRSGRTSATYPEVVMAALLEFAGVEFEAQKRVGNKICDFYLPATNSVVEVDGAYWDKYKDKPKRDAYLHEHGISFVQHVSDLTLGGWL